MVQDSYQHASKSSRDRLRTAPSALRVLQGSTQEAKILQIPCVVRCFLHCRPFASDGLLRPQDGSKMAQEGPKRGPRGAQEGPKSAQERPKRAPRGPQEAHLKAPTGGGKKSPPSFLIDGLQDNPRRRPGGPKRPPRGPQDAPKRPQDGFKRPRSLPRRPPRGYSKGSDGGIRIGDPPSFDRWPPRWPQEGLQGRQEGPKRAPRGPKRLPNCPQEVSTMVPRGLQDAPRATDRKGLDLSRRRRRRRRALLLSCRSLRPAVLK